MKKRKMLAGGFITVMVGIMGVTPIFAGESVSSFKKDGSTLENFNGNIKLEQKTDYEIKDVKTDSVSTTRVNVNTQKIKNGNGSLELKNERTLKYKNVDAAALVNVEVDINAPIIYGKTEDMNIKIENTSKTEYENTKAGYVFDGKYVYNNPVYIDLNM